MQMFTLGKNHNDIPEEHMSKHFLLLTFFSNQIPARVLRKSGYVKMQQSQLCPLCHRCATEVSCFHEFPAKNRRN